MEEVLETYEKAYDPDCPVVCMDEQPVQLIGETRVPIPATKEHPERVDYEYERKGTASIFMFAEPLSGFRQATARPHRTKDDWAHEVAQLLDTRYANTPRITLVCDNLNTHTKGAFYEAFPPEKARESCDGSTSSTPPSTLDDALVPWGRLRQPATVLVRPGRGVGRAQPRRRSGQTRGAARARHPIASVNSEDTESKFVESINGAM